MSGEHDILNRAFGATSSEAYPDWKHQGEVHRQNRVKILRVLQQDLLDLFKSPQPLFRVLFNQSVLPKDAFVIACYYSFNSQSFDFLVGSCEFDPAPKGSILPLVSELSQLSYTVLEKQTDGSYRESK